MPLNPGGLYGAVRALQDTDREDRARQAFELEQQSRREALETSRAERPLRMRTLEMGVESGEHAVERRPIIEKQQDELAALRAEISKLDKDERELKFKELKDSVAKQSKFRKGLGDFTVSKDPQKVADVLSELYPEHYPNAKAMRNPDGTITTTWGEEGKPQTHVYKGAKWDDGSVMTPDEELGATVFQSLDPLKVLAEKLKLKGEIAKEAAKQTAIGTRELAKEGEKTKRAEAKAVKEQAKRVTAELKTVSSEVLTGLKTASIPGHLQNVYSSEDDAKLVPHIKERASAIYKQNQDEEDMTPAKAARQAIEEVRTAFGQHKKEATDAARKLVAKKINPRDAAAVRAAVQAGDPDAIALAKALAGVTSKLGEDNGKYLFEQLPSIRK